VWTGLGCFGLTLLSAVFPWFSAEIVVLALPAVAGSGGELAVLVVVATAGQMAGKGLVYWGARKGSRLASPRMTQALVRWEQRLARWHSKPSALVFLSSAAGFPPFFLVTAFAGAARWDFPLFMLAGGAGRLLRFGVLVLVPWAFST
jgi:membrane protein YqaA with SNARE-associated domain